MLSQHIAQLIHMSFWQFDTCQKCHKSPENRRLWAWHCFYVI